MADRDTTSTPYKLSVDGVCYFRYPNGDAQLTQVADYAALRLLGAADSPTRSVQVTGEAIAGGFKWRQDSILASSDDGGLVIQAADGGHWVRHYAGAIRLDWYAPADGFHWSAILQDIEDSPFIQDFHILTPTVSTYGVLDKLLIQSDNVSFASGGTHYRFQQSALADNPDSYLTQVEFYSERIVLGANVEFYGRFDNKLYARNAPGQEYGMVVVHTQSLLSFEFYGEISEARQANGLVLYNDGSLPAGFEQFVLGGKLTSCGVAIQGGYDPLLPLVTCTPTFVISDPNGMGLGMVPGDADGPVSYDYWRTSKLDFSMAHRYEGQMIHEWGYTAHSSIVGGRDGIGSAQNPFKIYMQNTGYSALRPNRLLTWDVQEGTGKFDGYDNTDSSGTILSNVYIDFIWQGKTAFHWGHVWEASGQSPGEVKYVQGFNVRSILQHPESEYLCTHNALRSDLDPEGVQDQPGFVRYNTVEGIFGKIGMSDGPNTYNNIILTGAGFAYYHVFTTGFNPVFRDSSTDNPGDTINGMILRSACTDSERREASMNFNSGVVTINDLVVEGTANPTYPLITLGHSNASYTGRGNVTVNLVNPSLPVGSRVEVVAGHVGGTTEFQINGVPQTLPWEQT